jgi:hypothetical protein
MYLKINIQVTNIVISDYFIFNRHYLQLVSFYKITPLKTKVFIGRSVSTYSQNEFGINLAVKITKFNVN